MNVEKSIQTIEKVLIKLKALPNRNFNFKSWITALDLNEKNNHCNSIFCVYGWFPVWFPNSGIKHIKENFSYKMNYSHNDSKVLEITGFSKEISDCLFSGNSFYLNEKLVIESISLTSSKQEVIERWEKVLNFIKENKDLFKPIGTLD